LDDAGDLHHVLSGSVHVGIMAAANGGDQGGAQGARFAVARQMDGLTENVSVDLQPQTALRAAAPREQATHLDTVLLQVLENVAGAEGRRLINAAKDMAGAMGERQTPEDTAGARILERTAIPLPVIETDQPFAAWRHGGGPGIEKLVDIASRAFRLGKLVTRKVLAIPVEDGAGRGLAAFERVESFQHRVGITAEHAAAKDAAL